MVEIPSEGDDNGPPTIAGCLLLLLSLAVIGAVAVPLVTWRQPETGQPLPRMVSIFIPVIAGAIVFGIGTGLLRLLGVRVLAEAKKEPSESDRLARDNPNTPVDPPPE
jgi:hypothetical protein